MIFQLPAYELHGIKKNFKFFENLIVGQLFQSSPRAEKCTVLHSAHPQ